jgi:hypothetical protein
MSLDRGFDLLFLGLMSSGVQGPRAETKTMSKQCINIKYLLFLFRRGDERHDFVLIVHGCDRGVGCWLLVMCIFG